MVFEIHFCPLCQEEGLVGEQASIMTYVLFSMRMYKVGRCLGTCGAVLDI